VVGDAKDVEAEAAVEVDELRELELAVTPGRVRMQLEEEVVSHVSSVISTAGTRATGR
jgi:hypothetical protein